MLLGEWEFVSFVVGILNYGQYIRQVSGPGGLGPGGCGQPGDARYMDQRKGSVQVLCRPSA